jgi:hypothetical protein
MGLLELPLIVAGWILTAGLAGVGGAFALQGRNATKIDGLRNSSDQKIEKILIANEQKIQALVSSNNQQNQNVLEHIKNVEKALNDMRAELPEKYTLRSDYLRLFDKVEELSLQVYQHKEIISKAHGQG